MPLLCSVKESYTGLVGTKSGPIVNEGGIPLRSIDRPMNNIEKEYTFQ